MDSMPDEKCSIVLSEYWVGISSFILGCKLLVGVAACAIAAKLCPAEVPMMVPKNIGPDAVGCWFNSLFLDFVSQMVPSYEWI